MIAVGSPLVSPKHARKGKKSKTTLNWNNFNGRGEVRDALFERQRGYCAYCERRLVVTNDDRDEKKAHIDHLERRNAAPERIFDWNNLFLSCSRADSCGKFKDLSGDRAKKIDATRLVDPSKENPLDYFAFDAKDGAIIPRPEKSTVKYAKAAETIRTFNLDKSSKLCGVRKTIATIVGDFLELCDERGTVPTLKDKLAFVDENVDEKTDCVGVYYALLGLEALYGERY